MYIFLVGQSIVYMGCVVLFRIKRVIVHMFMSRLLLLAWNGCIDLLWLFFGVFCSTFNI